MKDLVIARYQEDVDWIYNIAGYFDRIFLYNKGKNSPELNIDNLIYSQLKNWGRESDTYLNHILLHYYDCADCTIFVQGKPFDHLPCFYKVVAGQDFVELNRLVRENHSGYRNFWKIHPEIAPLGLVWKMRQQEVALWDRYLWYEPMMQIFEIIYDVKAIPKTTRGVWGAQFAVSKKLLQKYSYNQYLKMKAVSDEHYYLPWGFEKYFLYMFSKNKTDFLNDSLIYPVI